ncbi:uncharacterized protein LACBIDRAFT_333774 [Laccaria bicolor S238N-H82]|uniref:Predicted protein n=1 Tax=Laccaria bicolor (strain S238N-H82 / ATCC MYA-4686) TaxID=486041 RepID=B0DX14_LACBS|nr:uncharacterized protein LACBIDRAFT_333774 [Laccaria bicolor S238N-H82]EDR00908.1 predicted protein [Laccaria bicolor S238N-H82]|eukprot:XP_001888502.1 predicted protein [Laccaria bicolor S238N-H82]
MNVRHRVNELRSYNESGEDLFLKDDERDGQLQPTAADESDTEDADTSNISPASRWRRLAFIFLCALVVLFAFLIRGSSKKKPETLYASRYSREFKFRPAASPIITETLKDGRMRLRGATPPPKTLEAKITPTTKARRKKKTGTRKPKRKTN